MANFFDRLANTLKLPLSGFGINDPKQVSAAISQNLNNPIGGPSNAASLGRVFGSEADFMSRYQNFQDLYRIALNKELESTAISGGQRRMIQAAMQGPSINLNLIRDLKQRNNLTSMLRNNVLGIQNMVQNFGAPGLGLPSSNLYRGAARYLVDQRSTSNHPVLSLINSVTFNIDPTKVGAEAFGIGKSNLPSFSALKNAFDQSKRITSGRGALDIFGTGKVNVFTFDVETTGLGVYDQVRSLAASTMEIDSSNKTRPFLIRNQVDMHFTTPEMGRYTMRDPSGRMTKLSSRCCTDGKYGCIRVNGSNNFTRKIGCS